MQETHLGHSAPQSEQRREKGPSIDVDIITPDDKAALVKAMDAVIETGAFTRWEPDERTAEQLLTPCPPRAVQLPIGVFPHGG